MPFKAKYVHTNLIAKDWRALAAFYQGVFGCTPVPPERDIHGAALEAATGIAGAALQGVHLRLPTSVGDEALPGYGDSGPTLEIFTYNAMQPRPSTAVNRPGFGHLAFLVDNVPAARAEVLAAGGSALGEVVTTQIATGARVSWCYVTDPEGNVLELQSWQ